MHTRYPKTLGRNEHNFEIKDSKRQFSKQDNNITTTTIISEYIINIILFHVFCL